MRPRALVLDIAPTVLADLGVRFAWSIIALASVNYLGLGLQPPTSDWGLMISENRQFISINGWAVIAPALMLAMLTISVNLIADSYARSLGQRAPTPAGAVPAATPVTSQAELVG